MQSIEDALREVRALHERLTGEPAPNIPPHALQPFPPGVDPVAHAIEEVAQLKAVVEAMEREEADAVWSPRAAVYSNEKSFLLQIELPGIRKDDLSVSVSEGHLVIRGERRAPELREELDPILMELNLGAFERRFVLPPWCTREAIAARCSNGVLEIYLRVPEGDPSSGFAVEVK